MADAASVAPKQERPCMSGETYTALREGWYRILRRVSEPTGDKQRWISRGVVT